MNYSTLYRPVGIFELELIWKTGMKAFPPRLDWQPIFYPVLNEAYAIQIAHDWNVNDENSGFAGFVTAFDIPTPYFESFEIQNVGAHMHNELWVPAEELVNFNNKIERGIRLTKAFYGEKWSDGNVSEGLKQLLSGLNP